MKHACLDFGAHKVDVPNLIFNLKPTPIFEGYMVGCESKNGHQEYMC